MSHLSAHTIYCGFGKGDTQEARKEMISYT